MKFVMLAVISFGVGTSLAAPAKKIKQKSITGPTPSVVLKAAEPALGSATADSNSLIMKAEQSRFQLDLSSENRSNVESQKIYGSGAPVASMNMVGLIYNKTPALSFGIRQYFEYLSNKENADKSTQATHQNNWESFGTHLRAVYKSPWSLWGSKPILTEFRYLLPNDRNSQENKRLGQLRWDGYAEWAFGSRWAAAAYLSPRVLLNSSENPNKAVGGDAEYYRLVASPQALYYFNDNLYAYYLYALDVRSRGAQRGDWTIDSGNYVAHELGVYWTLGAVTLNPSVSTDGDHNNASGAILTNESRIFSAESTNINFNIYSIF